MQIQDGRFRNGSPSSTPQVTWRLFVVSIPRTMIHSLVVGGLGEGIRQWVSTVIRRRQWEPEAGGMEQSEHMERQYGTKSFRTWKLADTGVWEEEWQTQKEWETQQSQVWEIRTRWPAGKAGGGACWGVWMNLVLPLQSSRALGGRRTCPLGSEDSQCGPETSRTGILPPTPICQRDRGGGVATCSLTSTQVTLTSLKFENHWLRGSGPQTLSCIKTPWTECWRRFLEPSPKFLTHWVGVCISKKLTCEASAAVQGTHFENHSSSNKRQKRSEPEMQTWGVIRVTEIVQVVGFLPWQLQPSPNGSLCFRYSQSILHTEVREIFQNHKSYHFTSSTRSSVPLSEPHTQSDWSAWSGLCLAPNPAHVPPSPATHCSDAQTGRSSPPQGLCPLRSPARNSPPSSQGHPPCFLLIPTEMSPS